MTARIDVSVVIPTRNRWGLLVRRGLRAALLQEGVDYEVVVVDDASTDETVERLEALDEPRVRIVQRGSVGGVAVARNDGIREARGEWIAFLDDDDFWAPFKLRLQLDAVLSAGADFAYASAVAVDEAARPLYALQAPAQETLPRDVIARCAIPAGSSNVLVRKELVRQLGGFDEQLLNMEDWDLWIRLAWSGSAAAIRDPLVAFLEHRGGKSLIRPSAAYERLSYLDRKHRALREAQGTDIDRVAFAHYVAWLQLRRRKHASAAGVYLRSSVRNRRPRDLLPAARFAARALLPVARSLQQPTPFDGTAGVEWLELYR